ncbi:hypothetical protein NM208_g2277 [Fusarium decemcellulare]|uniref:Uncharacterized protein n=1 Tax=Fusarium decemcellulare TaxID=57161 RepID=A0ACC1ST70_9HYPO|nr:hypothetical protein NM208_g2277 [Fusarium decemcellulare]
MASRLFQAYSGALARRPLLVQSATAATLYAVGDVIAQGTSSAANPGKAPRWDWERTMRMTAIGGFALGPTMAIWYRFLQTRIQLASHTRSVLARVLADQLVFAPASIVGLYYLKELLQPKSSSLREKLSVAQNNLEHSFSQVLIRNYTIWPAVSYLNFFYVPLQYRLLVSTTVGVFWSAYLSFAVNQLEYNIEETARVVV